MIKRSLRHLFTTASASKKAFPESCLELIESCIAAGEQQHRAEVRLIIESSLSMDAVINRLTSHERALELFGRYGIWDTEENNGVLLYINLADRQVEIVADRGISQKIPDSEWHRICQALTTGFKQGRFQESTLEALDAVSALLAIHFPSLGPRDNELPDRPIVL